MQLKPMSNTLIFYVFLICDICSQRDSDDEHSTASIEIYSDNEDATDAESVAEHLTYNKTSSSIILKGFFGKIPTRDDLRKLLINKFKVASRNLTSLTFVDVMEVMARKLVDLKYVKIILGDTTDQLYKRDDIKVLKKIDA